MATVRYTSVDKIHTRLPFIGSLSNLTSADTTEYISDAESVLEAKVAKLYTIPISDSPYFDKLATDASIFEILSKRVFTQERQNRSEWVDEFEEAFNKVDKIASGEIPLLTSSGDLISTRENVKEVWSNTESYHPTFSELGRLDQIQDTDKLDDLEDDRDL